MDATKNECEVKPKGYPTVLLFPKGSKKSPIEFKEIRNEKNVIEFIKKYAVASKNEISGMEYKKNKKEITKKLENSEENKEKKMMKNLEKSTMKNEKKLNQVEVEKMKGRALNDAFAKEFEKMKRVHENQVNKKEKKGSESVNIVKKETNNKQANKKEKPKEKELSFDESIPKKKDTKTSKQTKELTFVENVPVKNQKKNQAEDFNQMFDEDDWD